LILESNAAGTAAASIFILFVVIKIKMVPDFVKKFFTQVIPLIFCRYKFINGPYRIFLEFSLILLTGHAALLTPV